MGAEEGVINPATPLPSISVPTVTYMAVKYDAGVAFDVGDDDANAALAEPGRCFMHVDPVEVRAHGSHTNVHMPQRGKFPKECY
jgi:hypothetical protein